MSFRVTIGMPVFNGAKYIRQALDSIGRQTFEDYHLLISDNGSTDETMAICKAYSAKDSRIEVLQQQENIGAIANFNFVFTETSGEYFKWAAADDVFAPTFLEKCVDALDDDPQIAWCHSKSDKIDANGTSWLDKVAPDDPLVATANGQKWWRGHPRLWVNEFDPVTRFKSILLGTTWSVDSYGLIRRSHLQKTRMLVPLYGAEKVLLAELSLYGKYHHIDECLFQQRVHVEASSNIKSRKDQQKFAARKKNRLVSTRAALLTAHLNSVKRSDLSFTDKLRAFSVVMRYALQVKKWGRHLARMVKGKGVGGGGTEMMDRANKPKFAKKEVQ